MAILPPKKSTKPTDMQLVLRAAWRKAYQEGTLELPFTKESDAYRFRVHMYGEKRKTPPAEIDHILGLAYMSCEILNPKDCLLTIRLRMEGPMCQDALKGLGADIEALREEADGFEGQAVESKASESMLKMLELLKADEEDEVFIKSPELPPELTTVNPYFTRER